MNVPVIGAWVPVASIGADDIIIQRRNPYYWKVDEAGNQLPYLNELHYRLSTWADRDVQTVAGTARPLEPRAARELRRSPERGGAGRRLPPVSSLRPALLGYWPLSQPLGQRLG